MARRTNTYAIRLAVEGGGQVKAELVSVGQSGEQSLKRIESAGGKASGGLKDLGRQAELLRTGIRTLGAALAGVTTVGGLAALVNRSISAADAIGKTADKIGVGVEALQELRFAAKASGIEQQTLDMALQRFTRRTAEAAQGTGEAKDALAQLGITLRDQDGHLRRSEDMLADVADAFARIEDPAERVRLAFKLFDSEGVALVNLLVHWRSQRIQFGEDLVGGFGPGEGLGVGVVLGDVAMDRRLEVDDGVEGAPLESAPGECREEGLDRVQPGARGRREVKGPAGMPRQPGDDLGMLVAAVVIEDHVDHLAGRNGGLDGAQEAQELLVPVTLHATAEHRAVEDVKGSEQGGDAVAEIIVGHGAGLAWFDRQTGLGPIQGLNLAFLIDREHQAVRRRLDVQADDVLEFGGKLGIVGALEGPDAVGLQPVHGPDPLHRAQGNRRRLGHGTAGPVGGFAGRLGAGQRDHPVHRGVVQARFARLAGRIPEQAIDPGLGEAPLPAPDRRSADRSAPGDLGDRQSVGRAQDDPSPRHVLLGAIAISHDRLQTSTIRRRDPRADNLCHPTNIAHLPTYVNLLIASVH